MSVIVRVLKPEEYPRLREAESGTWQPNSPLPNPESAIIIVAEVGERIVAHWVIFTAVHLEAAWIAPDHRMKPRVLHQIFDLTFGILKDMGVLGVFTNASTEAVERLAQGLGFLKIPGSIYFTTLDRVKFGGERKVS